MKIERTTKKTSLNGLENDQRLIKQKTEQNLKERLQNKSKQLNGVLKGDDT